MIMTFKIVDGVKNGRHCEEEEEKEEKKKENEKEEEEKEDVRSKIYALARKRS